MGFENVGGCDRYLKVLVIYINNLSTFIIFFDGSNIINTN